MAPVIYVSSLPSLLSGRLTDMKDDLLACTPNPVATEARSSLGRDLPGLCTSLFLLSDT